jgi:hypothetical protein
MISTLFGLASDGKTNAKGMLILFQTAVIAWEFDDVVRFVKPPRIVQRVVRHMSILPPGPLPNRAESVADVVEAGR